jgi:hypothetical protein
MTPPSTCPFGIARQVCRAGTEPDAIRHSPCSGELPSSHSVNIRRCCNFFCVELPRRPGASRSTHALRRHSQGGQGDCLHIRCFNRSALRPCNLDLYPSTRVSVRRGVRPGGWPGVDAPGSDPRPGSTTTSRASGTSARTSPVESTLATSSTVVGLAHAGAGRLTLSSARGPHEAIVTSAPSAAGDSRKHRNASAAGSSAARQPGRSV